MGKIATMIKKYADSHLYGDSKDDAICAAFDAILPNVEEMEKETITTQSLPITEMEILYRCNRVWDAWNFGTMTRDDFEEVEVPLETSLIAQAKAEERERIVATLIEMIEPYNNTGFSNLNGIDCITAKSILRQAIERISNNQ